tara:strand:+ start:8158 stop:8790 length:633 start_codon:yes stop_codon:yes gene_type:complete
MDYYGYSYFYIFFFFFLFFLLIILILTPGYTRKDVVPPLTTQNYAVQMTGVTPQNSDGTAQFQPLRIADGESGSGGSALDFGGSGVDIIDVNFSPEYRYKNRDIAGYYVLYFQNGGLVTSPVGQSPSFLLRVRDYASSDTLASSSLSDYNAGWTSLVMNTATEDTLYKVILPFNVGAVSVHTLTVEIAPMNITSYDNSALRLNSAYIYYY